MQKLMGDEGWGGGGLFSLLTPSVCGKIVFPPAPKKGMVVSRKRAL